MAVTEFQEVSNEQYINLMAPKRNSAKQTQKRHIIPTPDKKNTRKSTPSSNKSPEAKSALTRR